MDLDSGAMLRAGITWGLIGIVLAVLNPTLSGILPNVSGLNLGTYALMFAGVHYSAKARSDFIQSAIGGGLAGILAGVFLVLVRLAQTIPVPMPPGAPTDLFSALIVGFIAGAAGGLGFEVIDR